MAFDPQKYMDKLGGKDYLPVAPRIMWFRHDNPHGIIDTNFIQVGDYIIARAKIIAEDGNELATGSATVRSYKDPKGATRDLEKAETAAIGRALAYAGYGTLQAGDEIDEGDHLAEAPATRKSERPQQLQSKTVSFVEVCEATDGKRYLKTEHGITSFTRQPFQDAGYDTDDWTTVNTRHVINARVYFTTNADGFKTVERVTNLDAPEEKSAS